MGYKNPVIASQKAKEYRKNILLKDPNYFKIKGKEFRDRMKDDETYIQKRKEYMRNYFGKPMKRKVFINSNNYTELRCNYMKAYRARYPEKQKARHLVYSALRNKSLLRLPCAICNNPKSEAHHEDYSKPLEVIWLCKSHHVEADMKLRKNKQFSPVL